MSEGSKQTWLTVRVRVSTLLLLDEVFNRHGGQRVEGATWPSEDSALPLYLVLSMSSLYLVLSLEKIVCTLEGHDNGMKFEIFIVCCTRHSESNQCH